jgi:hypothetical protein
MCVGLCVVCVSLGRVPPGSNPTVDEARFTLATRWICSHALPGSTNAIGVLQFFQAVITADASCLVSSSNFTTSRFSTLPTSRMV